MNSYQKLHQTWAKHLPKFKKPSYSTLKEWSAKYQWVSRSKAIHQEAKEQATKKTIEQLVTGMHCSSCAIIIDMDLEELEGVKKAQTSYAKGETEIEFDPQKVSDELILETIKRAGYTAQIENGKTN